MLFGVLLVFVLMVVTIVSAVLLGLRALRRRNEVSPRAPSGAPLRWMVWPAPLAVLHRRLRDAIVVLRAAVPARRRRRRHSEDDDVTPYERLADDIELHAARIDRDLLIVARLRGVTKDALRRELTRQVVELERLAQRVAAAASAATGQPGMEPTPAALSRVNAELDALEAAHAEIARLEADLGLRRPWPSPPVGSTRALP